MTQTEKRGRVPYLDWVRGMSRRLPDLEDARDQLDDPEEREQVDALIASIETEPRDLGRDHGRPIPDARRGLHVDRVLYRGGDRPGPSRPAGL